MCPGKRLRSSARANVLPRSGLSESFGSATPLSGMGMARLTSWLAALALLPAPAAAQYIGGRAPAPPQAPLAGAPESPEAALARNVRLLAINPRNYDALLGAGRAALRLGDAQAAIGFFGRAEEINSQHWAPKAGQGSALAQMGEAQAALGMFEQAQRLGATQSLVALNRGLAFDLLGRQAEAQNDYRVVLGGAEGDEARRRLALSLAISGRKADALAMLDPLLARRDAGARRARAFILALGGDHEGARQAIAAMMPGAANGFDPFLRRLGGLGPGQKAAAVHLGMMPADGTALASLDAGATPPAGPSAVSTVSARTRPAPGQSDAGASSARTEPVRSSRLAELDSVLQTLPASVAETRTPPPPPRPMVEKPVTRPSAKAATVKVAEASVPARPKPKAPDTAAGRSRIYVQLAGGANTDRMLTEYNRIKRREATLFRGLQPLVSEVRGWARLLVGPFKTQEDAQAFVNELHDARLEGFVWIAPPGAATEKLAAK